MKGALTIATRADVLVTVQGEVASVYILLRTLQVQLANARANVQLKQRSFDIAEVRNRNGLTSDLDVQHSSVAARYAVVDSQADDCHSPNQERFVVVDWSVAERVGGSD